MNRAACRFYGLMLGLAIGGAAPAFAQQPSTAERDQAEHFEQQIAPLLARQCLECHSGAAQEEGLDLSTKHSALAGGESGVAITPGDLDASLLWDYVVSDEIPKDRAPLSTDEKASLQRWIQSGATWTLATLDPFAQADAGKLSRGRNHHPQAFTNLLVGAGLQPGIAYGTTDALGYAAIENVTTTYDLHATVLHLLGIDHEQLTFYHNGIARRLTNVHGHVIDKILSAGTR